MTERAQHRRAAGPLGRAAGFRGAISGPARRWAIAQSAGRRGTAQLALLVVVAAVLGGLALGTGVASSSVHTGYDLAWLADGGRGQVVQIDAERGRTNVRLQVAASGAQLDIQQRDGQLVVVDRRTGKVTSVNIGTLLLSGSRTARAGAVKVLLGRDRMYIVDLARGTVQAADPATVANIGTPFSAGRPITDIGIDGRGQLWALDNSEHVIGLRWDTTRRTLARTGSYSLHGAGRGSVVVAHEQGVTVVGGQGAIARIGTGHDTTLTAARVAGPLAGPRTSPDTLVPVADPSRSSVIIVGGDDVLVDDVASLGCDRPMAPTVFQNKIYVPCSGAHKVIVLDAAGHQSGTAIPTPGRDDPQLTVTHDRLIVDSPGAGQARVIDGTGRSEAFRTLDANIPVQNPRAAPPAPPAPHHDNNTGNTGSNDHGDVPAIHDTGSHPSSGANPAGGSPASGDAASATASARDDGSVVVTWDGPAVSDGYTVTTTDSSASVADVPGGARSATVTVLDPGTTATFVVHARDHGRTRWSATTNTVTVTGAPGDVSGVRYTVAQHSGGTARLTVRWTAAPANGGPVSYSVASSATSNTTSTNDTTAVIEVPCGNKCGGTLTVTASNAAGHGRGAQIDYTVGSTGAAPIDQPTPEPQQPTQQAPQDPTTPPASEPTQAPMPVGGEQAITVSTTPGSDYTGEPAYANLTIDTPSDWKAWTGGTCTLYDTGAAVGDVPCNATAYQQTLEYYESGTHTYKLTAHGTSGSVDSAEASANVYYRPQGPCSNFVDLGGSGAQALPPCNECPQDPRYPRQACPFRAGPIVPSAPRSTPALAALIARGLFA